MTPRPRFAIVSDIHGNLPALEAVIAAIAAERIDAVVNLGDCLSGPLWPAETARRLMRLAWPTIAGNHERQLLTLSPDGMSPADRHAADAIDDEIRGWLRSLPAIRRLGEGEVLCCHGTPSSDLAYFLETVTPHDGRNGERGLRMATADEIRRRLGAEEASLVLCGHTHLPRVAGSGATTIVNPGSVGLPAFDDDHGHPHRVETGSPDARWAVVERASGGAGWQVSLRATPYDHAAAAAQALRNGRADWADALASGFVGRREAEIAIAHESR